MGCFWSCEGGDQERCHSCSRRAVNNLVVLNNQCEICRVRANRPRESIVLRPLFGEYRCPCGRKWMSRRSWQGRYQICKKCARNVHPHKQRELRPTDMSRDRDNVQDHPKELCQMCKELGYYCGKSRYVKG